MAITTKAFQGRFIGLIAVGVFLASALVLPAQNEKPPQWEVAASAQDAIINRIAEATTPSTSKKTAAAPPTGSRVVSAHKEADAPGSPAARMNIPDDYQIGSGDTL